MKKENIWVLNCGGRFPCGVFTSKAGAEIAINKYNLAGILTKYPLNQLAYDLAIEEDFLIPENIEQRTPAFIGKFAYSFAQDHYHYENGENETATYNCAGQHIIEPAKDAANNDPKHVSQLLTPIFDNIEKQYKPDANITGIPTNFVDLDHITNGLQRGSLIIIAGRHGMGKSALAVNIAQKVAKCKKTVAIFSLEKSNTQIVQRIISAEAELSQSAIQNGALSQSDWEKLADAANTMSKMSLFIDDNTFTSVMEIRSKCLRMKAGKDVLDLIIVDYLQLVGSERIEKREQQIADISRNLKALAQELDVPIIVVSQLNRIIELRADNTPSMLDLRESGAIEEDADQIIFIYRDECYDKNTTKKGIAEIIVSKNKNGKTGVVYLDFIHELAKFRNLYKK